MIRLRIVIIAIVFLALFFSVSFPVASSQSDAFQKFVFWYPPFNGGIGFPNQIEIELNLTSGLPAFTAGTPVTVSAAGGVFGSNGYVKNVTITFTGASPDQSQPAVGIVLNNPPVASVSGIVLFPASECPIHANGVIFSQPYLCGNPSTIEWQKAGIYHPIMTVYFNNQSAPFIENDTTDLVTVVAPLATTTAITTTTQSTTELVVTVQHQNPLTSFGALIIYAIGIIASVVTIYEFATGHIKLPRKKNRNPKHPRKSNEQLNPQKKTEVKGTKGNNEKKK